ncbi:ABC transporter family substrate-binding protein [Allokutzneria albata]|uniref:Peptide/nickel transport system substrate-binding protein n=1 Tax=Allokutzneria albata TaxID=211114 RepID=A0A1G9YM72_ALLAB|nr:ABC transporter family substrate-binding protein [Allokutzneria albata]SDN09583.1 peptide/nickel transport system substrate-binding protein [Allokutzneria albata]
MRRSKAVSALAVMTVGVLALSACGGGGGTSGGSEGGGVLTAAKGSQPDGIYKAPKVKPGKEVVVGHDAPYTTFNNQTADGNNFNNTLVANLVLTEPFFVDINNKVLLNGDVMDAVEETSKSPQVITYKIKKGVQWSDGAAWDCDDFYLAWLSQSGKAKKPDGKSTYFTPAGTNGYEYITPECKDDLTFVTTYSQPYADYKGIFDKASMLPAHILEKETGVADITKVTPTSPEVEKVATFWNTGWNGFKKEIMPASGPFKFDSWQQGQYVRFVRNEKWAGNPAGPEAITMKSISDPTAQKQALQNGEMQIIAPQAEPVLAGQLRELSSQGVKYSAKPGLTFEHLDLNFKRPLFQDKAFRQAFAECINRNEIVDKLVKGVDPAAKPLGSLLFMQDEAGYKDDFSAVMPADPAKAGKTLEAAGWAKGADGIYAKGGQKASFKISHTDIPRRKQTVELIQSSCRQAGIQIADDTDPNFLDERVSNSDYDVALFAWVGSPFKAEKKPIYVTGGGQNWQGYSNKTVDAEMPKVDTEFDEAVRDAALQRANKAMAEDYASLPLFSLANLIAFNDNVTNVGYHSRNGSTWNAWEWEIS